MTVHTSPPARARRETQRVHPGFVAAAVAVLLGVGGLVVGARQAAGTAPPARVEASVPADGVTVGDITVSGAWVRQPASPTVAAAYLSIRNAGSQADSLQSVYSGAARETVLHGQPGVVQPGAHVASGPLAVPAGAVVTLSPARGHVMLEGLTGPLRPGDRVSLLLQFARAGQVLVEAPVIAIGAAAPTGAGP